MITNATLNSIALAGSPSKWGDVTPAGATALSGVRCCLTEPTYVQRMAIGQIVRDITAVMYVLKADLPAGVTPAENATLSIALDGETPAPYSVAQVKDLVKGGGLSHFECFLRGPA